MAKYKQIDTSPRFIAVDLERQLLWAVGNRQEARCRPKVGADEATALQGGQAKNAFLAVADGGTAIRETPTPKSNGAENPAPFLRPFSGE